MDATTFNTSLQKLNSTIDIKVRRLLDGVNKLVDKVDLNKEAQKITDLHMELKTFERDNEVKGGLRNPYFGAPTERAVISHLDGLDPILLSQEIKKSVQEKVDGSLDAITEKLNRLKSTLAEYITSSD